MFSWLKRWLSEASPAQPVEVFEGQPVWRLPKGVAGPEGTAVHDSASVSALCPRCGQTMAESLIVSRLPLEVPPADEEPVVIDGWACRTCATMAGPRPLATDESVRWGQRGMQHATACEFLPAEWWFKRIASSWPTYAAAHLDQATSLLQHANSGVPETTRERLLTRAIATLRRAEAAMRAEPERTVPTVVAAVLITLADALTQAEAWSEARAVLARAVGLELSVPIARRFETLHAQLATEPEVFRAATAVVLPYLRTMERPTQVIPLEERSKVRAAVERLERHAIAHGGWPSAWFAGKGWEALEEPALALAVWQRAVASHAGVLEVVREAAMAFLRVNRNEAARLTLRRASELLPNSAEVASNLALTELVCGDLASARMSIERALALDPNDVISKNLHRAIELWAAAGRTPVSLAELETRRP